jgi:hypothetical protein
MVLIYGYRTANGRSCRGGSFNADKTNQNTRHGASCMDESEVVYVLQVTVEGKISSQKSFLTTWVSGGHCIVEHHVHNSNPHLFYAQSLGGTDVVFSCPTDVRVVCIENVHTCLCILQWKHF